MTYIRTIMLGRLGASEDWSCSLTWRNYELVPASMTQTMVESLANRLVANVTATTGWAAIRTLWSSAVTLTGFRVEQREEDETLRNVGQAAYATPISGTGNATKSPQDACVVSLRTSTPGARGRGRVYMPALGAALNAEFALAGPLPASVAAGAAALFKLVGDQVNAEWAANSFAVTTELAVRSVTDHQCRKVERLQVGSALDTQRRRRDRLVESYAVTKYPDA